MRAFLASYSGMSPMGARGRGELVMICVLLLVLVLFVTPTSRGMGLLNAASWPSHTTSRVWDGLAEILG